MASLTVWSFCRFSISFFLDTRELLVYNLAGIVGTIINIVEFIGVGGYFEKKFGDNQKRRRSVGLRRLFCFWECGELLDLKSAALEHCLKARLIDGFDVSVLRLDGAVLD